MSERDHPQTAAHTRRDDGAARPVARINDSDYLPIEDYGAIGNLRTVALVGINGSIDWCCFPDLDRPSVFAALLDHRRGGCFRIAPVGRYESDQRYLPDTNVLETSFTAGGGSLKVTDFMPLRGSIIGMDVEPAPSTIHRIVQCTAGDVEVELLWAPRFDYARRMPTITRTRQGWIAAAAGDRLVLAGVDDGDIVDWNDGPAVRARFSLRSGERVDVATRWAATPRPHERTAIDAALEETVRAWRDWTAEIEKQNDHGFAGAWRDRVARSGLVLKLLTHPDTGAIAAAATTSLPEEIGGVRNWDYRYTWIRDAAFTVQALTSLGHHAEALDFLFWAERVSQARGEGEPHLRIMYGLHGETDLTEYILPHLEGYRGSKPVRIGNAAAEQTQLDIYGELIGSAYEVARLGVELPPDIWAFLGRVADRAAGAWREPDYGIWEVRGGPRHFVYSKVMVWVALDRAITMARRFDIPGDVALWKRTRADIKKAVLEQGYDADVGAFVQSFGSTALDASNLLIPTVGLLPFDDPRVQSTIDRTMEQLLHNGLVYRYLADDGIPGGEGAFGLTTFWLCDALTLSGRLDEAGELFDGMAARASRLGLYAEEIDPVSGAALGNFPQAFTHIGFINSALYLARAHGSEPAVPPIGSAEHKAETG